MLPPLEYLTDAPKTLIDERGKTHGDYTAMADLAVKLFELTEPRHGVESSSTRLGRWMICVKQARAACGDPGFPDHWRDIAGYATLVADRLEK